MFTLFLNGILPFIQRNWKIILVAVLSLSLYCYVANLKHQIVDLNEQLVICNENNVKLQNSIVAVNSSLEVISDTMDDTTKQFDKLNDNITNSNKQLKNKMDKFLANDIKPVDCPSTIKYLIDAKSEYK